MPKRLSFCRFFCDFCGNRILKQNLARPIQLRQKMAGFGRDLEVPDWGIKIGRFSGKMGATNGSGIQPAATPQNDPNLDPKTPQFLSIFAELLWQPSFEGKSCV